MSEREPTQPVRRMSRRQTLRYLGGAVAVAPLTALLGCGDDASSGGAAGSSGSAAGGGSGTLASSAGRAGSAAGSGGKSGASGSGGGWAAGGTAAMTALASYPNPFAGTSDSSCSLSCQLTLGPCHDDKAPEREDISEGKAGLPMRFGLRILDDKCQPVTDANVDIWHCDAQGVYSSSTADNPQFCTGDNAAALAARFFRGYRNTDAQGVAWFSTCFPGWYASRAIHVHFTVRRSSRQGTEYLTSQVAFPTDLISEVCTTHPDYSAHGTPDTPNTLDTVFPSASVSDYLVQTQRLSDGALLAYKTIIIRSNLSDSVCGTSSAGPGGAMGGPPPRG